MNFLLIGRPNVGKSSIYNILTNSKKNITHKEEGTTRDWHKSNISNLNNVQLFDTPGIIINNNKINRIQYSQLFNIIDKLIYVVDYNEDNFSLELETINRLRSLNKEIIIIINKDDRLKKDLNIDLFGVNKSFFLSCAHKLGFDEIYEFLSLYDNEVVSELVPFFSVAIFGKPNAGKSTLANSLLGFNRISTSPIAGTTSDFVEDTFIYKNKCFKVLDTAGIFKKNKVDNNSINYEAIRKSLNIINQINLSILLIDSNDGFDSQAKKILNMLINKSSSVVIIFNKTDTLKEKSKFTNKARLIVKQTYSQTKNLSIIFLSAKNKFHINKLKSTLLSKSNRIIKKLPTSKLNYCIKKSSEEKPHPLIKGKVVKFKYAVQVSSYPLTIKIFSNFSKEIKKNYKTYLINKLIKNFKIEDTKVNLIFTAAKNPFN